MPEAVRRDVAYRADIDGLRAIAVTSVVLFHANTPGFGGGYVGVDIFFVISGYLITRVLERDGLDRRGFARFYGRRVRRILPALIVMLAGSGVAAYWLLPPDYFVSYLKSVVATCLGVSNVLFGRGGGYFALPAQYQPLFHTWSLGVEEQFYLVFPFALGIVARVAKRHVTAAMAVVAILSLAGSENGLRQGWQPGFFFTPFRVWELLLGSLLAVGAVPELRSALARRGLATMGLALIAVSVFAFTPRTPFPGFHALAPCLGAALLIAANSGSRTWTSSLLAARPLVFVGRISYSLYLWHWPILTLAPLILLRTLSVGDRVAAVIVAGVVATLSWKFVEQPLRRGRALVPTRWLAVAGAASLAGVVLVSLAGYRNSGWPGRWSLPARHLLTYLDYANSAERQAVWRTGECYVTGSSTTVQERCMNPATGLKNVLLVGDSVAAELAEPLRTLLETRGAHLLQATLAGCLPMVSPMSGMSPSCQDITDRALDLARRHRVDAVVIATAWARMVEPTIVASGIESTIAALHEAHVRVVLLGPPVIYDVPVPLLLALQMDRYGAVRRRPSANFLPGLSAWSARLARQFGQRDDVVYVPFFERTCPDAVCDQQLPDGTPMQFDQIHLTAAAARTQAARVFDAETLRKLVGS